ncbi:GNAT family N-acetyltransferase [Pediococcus pentosaceus]|jgi:putative acetyltransferase|uniref:Acetyltransferase, GNAT family n=1 Tax=Pediococcus pentosaceus (strain ATCC 25745 / CCUG 21536 / LMG 10740 / 183-1w) TaxID=278197 RepID=Q03GN6_PEDPA|nr:GNAT family N-acetyltransferase [Pediococcus pentosaceus]ABJ67636.1 Acetyltransferase, GNAT family [Pediococcus pentosaceus ATCC 25745]MCV3320356.1 GNAT family N-acetyltransferase [Pediococcus pentosaceus]MEB3376412.1 GNAT family N-acetyltransferase [Pediococcus pentosaceus]QHM64826.1 putative N-acetyltransferase YafP [Pediococcus pentosaceus]QHM66545.1 putative N-acetyltransferase YafP [Pediococcus pentosaceus]
MHIRKYQITDEDSTLMMISKSIRETNQKDYNQKQIEVWSNIDKQKWKKSTLNNIALVAINSSGVIGFADMSTSGYLDHLFVHPKYQRQRIATSLVNKLEQTITSSEYSTYASITAVPFFEKMGYHIIHTNCALLRNTYFLNYKMVK